MGARCELGTCTTGAELELVPPQLLLLCALWSELLRGRAAKPWLSQESAASRGWSSRMVGGVPSCSGAFSMAEGADSACNSPAQQPAGAHARSTGDGAALAGS